MFDPAIFDYPPGYHRTASGLIAPRRHNVVEAGLPGVVGCGFFPGGKLNVIVNGGFDTNTDWTLANATISGGKCNVTSGGNFLQQNGRLVNGVTYTFSLDWTTTAGYANSSGRLRIGCSGGTLVFSSTLPANGSGTFTGSFVGSSSTNFVLQSDQQVFSGTIDNIKVYKA